MIYSEEIILGAVHILRHSLILSFSEGPPLLSSIVFRIFTSLHASHVTCHMAHVTCHMSHLHFFKGWS